MKSGESMGFPLVSLANGQRPLVWKNGQADPIVASFSLAVRCISRRNSRYAASPLHWSRIWASLSSNSPTVLQSLKGQPLLKAGHLAATPLCSFGSLANGQTLSAKTGHSRFNWVRVTEAGYWIEQTSI